MTDAIVYCRFSPRPDANTSTSNERQEERCRAFCLAHDYNIVGIFQDRNVSGSILNRKALQAVLEELQNGMVLVVDTSDRLARDMLVYLTIQQRVREAGARIEFADSTPPAITPEGELIANIFAAFSQYQRATIRKRTKAGLARKRDSGMYLGKCPIGYSRGERGDLVPHTYEQSIIAEIVSKHNRGLKPIEIANGLNSCFCSVRGKPWNERTIRRIIQREKKTLDNSAGA